VGSEQLTLNLELRYMTFHHEFQGEEFDFQFLLFHDLGGVNLSSHPQWMNGYGTGLRLYWNKVFLITFFAGFSKEAGMQFY
jgi:hemolysin activation/secretion protein